MFTEWTCVSVKEGPGMVPDDVQTALQMAACSLVMDQIGARHVSSTVCDAYIETERKTYVVGTKAGVLFKAQVNSNGGDYKVNFLIAESDLQSGATQLREALEEGDFTAFPGYSGVPELTEFLKTTGTARLQ
ncbi:hypothetical protein COB52_01375 [Candidatus Kaiserbacteria bacterium]|nr:MAG: hypothetical protein COB52_01375 [Candidatus Kaiserbacteria bacterium]